MAAQQLITDHLDIWTAAHKTRSTAGRGSSNKLDLYGIKKLRELILELAVRGKLVPQNPNDEPASELLKNVTLARANLINKGLIKKDRLFTAIGEDEKPFGLPDSWQWVRFPEICSFKPGKTPDTKNLSYWTETGVPWINIADMEHYGTVTSTGKTISIDAAEKIFGGEIVKAGSIIMSFKLTVGKISKLGIDAYHNEAIISVNPFEGISKEFIFRFLPSRAQAGNTKKAIMGNTLNSESLALVLIPLPPLAEQHRIVAKADELMAFCDQLEQAQSDNIAAHAQLVEALLATLANSSDHNELQNNWQRIATHFNTLFTTEHSIDQLKQTILQLAIMGKLVPQSAFDEPATELLKKIAAEKAQLIKEGKIKKEKPLPEITDEEKPFELPEEWQWVCWGEILAYDNAAFKRGPFGSSLTKGMFISEGYKVYEQYCPINDDCSFERYYISDEKFEELKGFAVKEGDFLVSCTGATLGRITQVPAGFKEGVINQALLRVRINNAFIDSNFFKLLFRSPFFQKSIFANSKGSAIPNVKGVGDLKVMPVPLLSIREQKCIVAKVNELMTLCDTLKTNLLDAQTTQLALADALVASVVGNNNAEITIEKFKKITMNIITPLELVPTATLKSDALLAKIIKSEGRDIDAKKVWQKSKLDLPSFYKQLKIEIAAGYIVKPSAAEF